MKYPIAIYKSKTSKILELRIIAKEDVLKIYKCMYENAELFLKRKFEKFDIVYKGKELQNENLLRT